MLIVEGFRSIQSSRLRPDFNAENNPKRPLREDTAGIIIPSKDFATLPKLARQNRPKNKTQSQDDALLRSIVDDQNIVPPTPVEEREKAQRSPTIIEPLQTETSQAQNTEISSLQSNSLEKQPKSSNPSSENSDLAQQSRKARSHQSGKYALNAFTKNSAGKSDSRVCGTTVIPSVSTEGVKSLCILEFYAPSNLSW